MRDLSKALRSGLFTLIAAATAFALLATACSNERRVTTDDLRTESTPSAVVYESETEPESTPSAAVDEPESEPESTPSAASEESEPTVEAEGETTRVVPPRTTTDSDGADAEDPDVSPDETAAPTASTPTPEATAASTPTAEATTAPTPTPEPTATSTPEPVDPMSATSLRTVECPAETAHPQVSCSIATLPENDETPNDGRTVELMIAEVDNGDPVGAGPVVFLQGGPGVPSVRWASRFIGANYDIIFVDQRGTGFSTPTLDCPEVDELWDEFFTYEVRDTFGEDVYFQQHRDCRNRLVADGLRVENFNSETNADDIALLRQVLGFEEWSLWGISYGTKLALTVMRDHPEGVRAVIIDSVFPLDVDFFAAVPFNAERSFSALIAACAASSDCTAKYGDLAETLEAAAEGLSNEPASVPVVRVTGATFDFHVDGSTLYSILFSQLYNTFVLPELPRLITAASERNLGELVQQYVDAQDPAGFTFSEGFYYSTLCREEFPYHEPADVSGLPRDLRIALEFDEIGELCSIWLVPPAGPEADAPVVSEIPTLVLAGAFDPITPPSWSQSAASQLPNSIYVEFADHGHGMLGACPSQISAAFMANPTASLDLSCSQLLSDPIFE